MHHIPILPLLVVVFGVAILIFSQNGGSVNSHYNEGVDENILTWDVPSDLREKYPSYLSGFDRDGNPVWIFEYGSWDVAALSSSSQKDRDEFHKYVDHVIAGWADSPRKHSTPQKNLTRYSVVGNYEGFSLTQFLDLNAVNEYATLVRKYLSSENKHKNVRQADLVNVNTYFGSVWNTLVPLFGNTINKYRIHGEDEEEWKKVLAKNYGRQALPKKYGGDL